MLVALGIGIVRTTRLERVGPRVSIVAMLVAALLCLPNHVQAAGPAARRDEIALVACRVVAEHGFENATVVRIAREAGYTTAITGKWHLGHGERYQPQSRGFDEFFGFLGGAHPYEPAGGVETGPNAIRRGREAVDEPEYLTRAFAREAVSFIERNAERPFCLCLAFNAVHAPLEAPEKYLSKYAQIEDPKRRAYAAMTHALDDAVGAILEIEGDTPAHLLARAVSFTTDNMSPCKDQPVACPTPLAHRMVAMAALAAADLWPGPNRRECEDHFVDLGLDVSEGLHLWAKGAVALHPGLRKGADPTTFRKTGNIWEKW